MRIASRTQSHHSANATWLHSSKKGAPMKIFIILSFLFASSTSYAVKKKTSRHHEAHVHGAATLNIAFDQFQGKIEFKAASEGILGFEHKIKSEKDKIKFNSILTKFESDIGKMIKFEDSLGCVFSKEKIEMNSEQEKPEEKNKDHQAHQGEHSDFVANYSVVCKKAPKGTNLIFDFSYFKDLNDLDVTLLIDELQKSVEIKHKPVTVELK
jgi:type III secretory pathway component EscV